MKLLRTITIALFGLMLILTGITEFGIRARRDDTPPVITCGSGVLEASVSAPPEELLADITAWDDQDGDITDRVLVEHVSSLVDEDQARITYVVFDSSDNAARYTRTIHYTDYQKPRFRLTAPLVYNTGDTITLLDRLTAEDVIDGEIQEKIRMTASNLSNTLPGTYHVTVQVTNSLGDTSVLPLSIQVVESAPTRTPRIRLTDYLVYVDRDSAFSPGDYIERVMDPMDSPAVVDPERVDILENVDTSRAGVYEVIYSYDGVSREAKAILTVVVT